MSTVSQSDKCPVCGRPGFLMSSKEGTQWFAPRPGEITMTPEQAEELRKEIGLLESYFELDGSVQLHKNDVRDLVKVAKQIFGDLSPEGSQGA